MTLLITGGAGFIGTNIALEAISQGHKVIAFDSITRKGTEDNISIIEKSGAGILRADVRNKEDFKRIKGNIDGIIHLAGNPGIQVSLEWPMYDFEANTIGTLNVLEYSRSMGNIPVIFASTNKIYSEEINLLPVIEDDSRLRWDFNNFSKNYTREAVMEGISQKGINENFPMDSAGLFPHTPYGASKASSDIYCQEYFHTFGVPTVVNRMSCIYGLYQKGIEDQGWIDWFVRAALHNKPLNIYGNGKQVRDALFGTDLAKLYLLELENIEKVKGKVFNIGGGIEKTTSLLEMISWLENRLKSKMQIIYKDWRKADQKIYISDITKVQDILKWKPTTSINEGLEIMWENIKKYN